MESRNFEEDLNNSNDELLISEWKRILNLAFPNCKINIDNSINIQLGYGTDCNIITTKGRRFSIEFKTRNSNTMLKPYIMELVHHIYTDESKKIKKATKSGWIYTCTADFIFHATLNKERTKIIECIAYTMTPFKLESWKNNFNSFDKMWLSTKYDNGDYQLTLNSLVPKNIISSNANEFGELQKMLGVQVWRWQNE